MSDSIFDRVARLDPDERQAYLNSLTPEQLDLFMAKDWSVMGRPEQFIPDDPEMFLWFLRAGRGYGKTLCGSQATKEKISETAGKLQAGDTVRWALMSQRNSDVLSTMYEGETGLKRCIPDSWLPRGWDFALNRSSLTLRCVVEGRDVEIQGFSARVPDGPRGPQFHGGWVDEPGSFPDAQLGLDEDTAMSNLLFGMRLQPFGLLIVTGTPKNNRLIRELRKMKGAVETHGRTRENLHNLAEIFKATVVARYQGTRLGRQELDAEILEGIGVMFQRGWFPVCEAGRPQWHNDRGTERRVRYWDLASGEESDANPDPDWTAGARVVFHPPSRMYLIEHIERFRLTPGARERRMKTIAKEDGISPVWMEKEPGNAGKAQLYMIGKELEQVGVALRGNPVTGPKETRAELVATASEQGRVEMLEGDWNVVFLDEAEEFPGGSHDDMVDAVAGAFQVLREDSPGAVVGRPAGQDIPRSGSGGGQDIPKPRSRWSA